MTIESSSLYTFNATRFDNQVKYECHIWNQALRIPLRIEQYLHVKCMYKHKKVTITICSAFHL